MELKKVPLADTHAFSPFFLDYIKQEEKLKPFFHRFPSLENAEAQLKERLDSFPAQTREVLATSLERQYNGLAVPEKVKSNIRLLRDAKTVTITTGHQLNIFTGPLYFVYKIVTVINACKDLKKRYPDFNFVPVYWMASEDHDYEEIKYFRLYGKKYTWNTNQKGAVGRFSTTGFDALLKEIPGEIKIFQDAYLKNKTLAAAARYYVNALFGMEGLLIVDGDDRELKSLFSRVVVEDVLRHSTLPLVEKTNNQLESLGYKTQVYCDGLRSRIERDGDRLKVVDTDLSFSEQEIQSMIASEPEKFSPNVILRPLYQEMILPNIAYVGGPAEVVYWLQLKAVFHHFNTPFPMLMPRNFGLVIDHHIYRKFEKTGLELPILC
jgi:bacillithiol synthase